MILNFLLVLYGCVALLNLVLMLSLHYLHDRRGYYLTAAGAWVGILAGYFADGFIQNYVGNVMHIFGIPFVSIMTYCFAKLACDIYKVHLPLKKMAIVSFGAWISGMLMHYLFGAPFAVASFIICLGIILPSIGTFYKLSQLWSKLTIIDKLFAVIILLDAIHIMDYPFLRLDANTAVYGFSIALAFVYLASLLLPIVINRRLAADLNELLEVKVEERSAELLAARQKMITAAKMSALGEMAGGMAHEINTPLALIRITSEQAREILSDESYDKQDLIQMTETISSTVARISDIVQGLRTFARDGSADPFIGVPVRQILANTIVLCQEKIKYSDIKFQIDEIPADYVIPCRQVQISQVLLNLIGNACDAVDGLPEKWVRVGVRKTSDGSIQIMVTDSGPGIPESVQKRLFQPFFTTKDIGKGTGLGLSISKGIMESHGGFLTLDSACANTRFVMECPTAVPRSGQIKAV